MIPTQISLPLSLLATSLLAVTAVLTSEPADSSGAACLDRDSDGFGVGCPRGADCNDQVPGMHPGAEEVCDFVDNDCNGFVDDAAACPQPEAAPERLEVAAARFTMGSNGGAADEQPVHDVEVGAFLLDRAEVTNARYRACVDAGACRSPALRTSRKRPSYFGDPRFDDYPVIFVSWHQAEAFCHWAGGRLPSEAEWERAARGQAPSRRIFPWGNEEPSCSRANIGGAASCIGDTDVVGRRPRGQSPVGSLDMAGNVWEWVADWYAADYYRHSPSKNPPGPRSGTLKVMRGGCWESGASSLRVSCRRADLPKAWADNVGFRCAYDDQGER
jgi:formylglycine-generating enzyme required for sulfatase activity